MYLIKKYLHDANGGGGGGATTSSGAGTGGSTVVKIDVDIYNAIVDSIEEHTNAIIEDDKNYVDPDSACLLNDVIPDYQEADHEVVDMLKKLKEELTCVIAAMRTMRDNYNNVDDTKSQESVYGNGGASNGAGTGSSSGG